MVAKSGGNEMEPPFNRRAWVRFTCRVRDRKKRESAKQDAKKKSKISLFSFFVLFVTFVDKNPESHRQSAG
jgi:hypothetical protein